MHHTVSSRRCDSPPGADLNDSVCPSQWTRMTVLVQGSEPYKDCTEKINSTFTLQSRSIAISSSRGGATGKACWEARWQCDTGGEGRTARTLRGRPAKRINENKLQAKVTEPRDASPQCVPDKLRWRPSKVQWTIIKVLQDSTVWCERTSLFHHASHSEGSQAG